MSTSTCSGVAKKTQMMRFCKSVLDIMKLSFLWYPVMKAWASVVYPADFPEHFILMVRTYVAELIG